MSDGERGYAQPGFATQAQAHAAGERWLASRNTAPQDDHPLHGHVEDGCGKQLLTSLACGAGVALSVLLPWML